MPDRNATIKIQTITDLNNIRQMDQEFKALSADEQQLIKDGIALTRQFAQLKAAQGDAAGGAALLKNTVSGLSGAPASAVLSLETQFANLNKRAQEGPSLAQQFGDSFKSGLVSIIGPAAAATAAITALKGAADLTVAGETTNRVNRSFESLARQANTTGDALLAAERKASGGEISDLNLELATDKGLLLGVADSASEFADIMTIARDRAAKMGTTTTQAFDDITTGIGRESPRILDNLGIIVDADAAHKAYAESIGKSVDQLSKAERIEALRNAVIAQGKGTLDAATTAINDQTNSYTRLGTALDNAKNKLGSVLSAQTQGAAGGVADILQGILNPNNDTASKAAGGAQTLVRALAGLPPVTKESQDAQVAWTKSVFDWIQAREIQIGLLSGPSSGGGGSFDFAPDPAILEQAIAQAKRVGGAFDEDRQALGRLQVALGTSEGAIQKSADASALDAAKKDLQTAATQKTAFETTAAADAFIRLNPSLDASQAFAAAAAAGLGPLVSQVIALRVEANKTRAALLGAKLNDQTARELVGAGSDRADIETGKHAGVVAGRAQGQAQAAAAAEALRQSQAAQGNLAPSLEHAQAELAQLTKGSAAYIQKQQEIRDIQDQQNQAGQQAVADQVAYAKATGNTVEARRLLNQELAAAKASGDIGKQARILDEISGLNKAHNSGLDKTLSLNEKIYDSLNRQKDAELDLEESRIRGRQEARKAATDDKTAQRVIAALGNRTDARAEDFRARAQDVIDLDDVRRRKRAQEEIEKQATAGGTITKSGKLLQSVPGNGAPADTSTPQAVGPITPAGAGLPSAPAAGASPAGAGGTLVLTDAAGTVLAKLVSPLLMDELIKGVRTVGIQRGG